MTEDEAKKYLQKSIRKINRHTNAILFSTVDVCKVTYTIHLIISIRYKKTDRIFTECIQISSLHISDKFIKKIDKWLFHNMYKYDIAKIKFKLSKIKPHVI